MKTSGQGPEGRLKKLRATVTALVKYERVELQYPRADEARGYAERVSHSPLRVVGSFRSEDRSPRFVPCFPDVD